MLFVFSLRDAVASMMENQPHVINNPVYLSALAASLFSGDGHESQAVLEENNVRAHAVTSCTTPKYVQCLSKVVSKVRH